MTSSNIGSSAHRGVKSLAALISVLAFTVSVIAPAITHAAPVAATLYVNAATGSDTNDGTTSSDPFLTIQAAVNAATSGDAIDVAAGTYDAFQVVGKSDLTITGAGAGQTIIEPTTLIDTGVGHKYTSDMLASVFVSTSTDITIDGMTIEGNGQAPGLGGPDALVFWNASTGTVSDSAITGNYTINGDQTGQGIAVDAGTADSVEQTANLTVTDDTISGFQKNAIDAVDGNSTTSSPGSITLTVTGGSITGAGSTSTIAQNGILVWNRGGGTVTGTVNGTTISDLVYAPYQDDVAVYTYGSATITSVSNVTFSNDDYYIYNGSTDTTPIDATTGNTFDGVSLGNATSAQISAIENDLEGAISDYPVAPEVVTNAATDVTASDATVNATNGGNDAAGHSFWVSTSTIDMSSPNLPAGVYSTPDMGTIAANGTFSASLSSLTTDAVTSGGATGVNLPAITPDTTYYYVAWSLVDG